MAWEQHVYWTRMLLISIVERLNDQEAVIKRLMQNPNDIAMIFADFYDKNTAKAISDLLSEHLSIGAQLITALRDGKKDEAEILNRNWFVNADKMAEAFSKINPYYKYNDLREMLYKHLNLTKKEVTMRLAKDYTSDIEAFNIVENEIMEMADYFVSGIIRQFPQNFDIIKFQNNNL